MWGRAALRLWSLRRLLHPRALAPKILDALLLLWQTLWVALFCYKLCWEILFHLMQQVRAPIPAGACVCVCMCVCVSVGAQPTELLRCVCVCRWGPGAAQADRRRVGVGEGPAGGSASFLADRRALLSGAPGGSGCPSCAQGGRGSVPLALALQTGLPHLPLCLPPPPPPAPQPRTPGVPGWRFPLPALVPAATAVAAADGGGASVGLPLGGSVAGGRRRDPPGRRCPRCACTPGAPRGRCRGGGGARPAGLWPWGAAQALQAGGGGAVPEPGAAGGKAVVEQPLPGAAEGAARAPGAVAGTGPNTVASGPGRAERSLGNS